MKMTLFSQPGPPLPNFRTLLIKGQYHASAPIHLALSYLAESSDPNAEVIFITPSREAIVRALHTHNDDWLVMNSGCGDVTALSARIKI